MHRLKSFAISTAAALFFALALSGCFLSNLQPWCPRGATVFEPALLGTWNMKNCSDSSESRQGYCVMTWTSVEDEYAKGKKEKGYDIAFRGDNGVESAYKAFLFEAGGERFLESLVDTPPKVDAAYTVHSIPVIVVWRVRMVEGKLSLEPIKIKWAADLARTGKLPTHTMADTDYPLLNIPPTEAKAFLAKHAKDPQAFDDAKLWSKGAPPEVGTTPKENEKPEPKK